LTLVCCQRDEERNEGVDYSGTEFLQYYHTFVRIFTAEQHECQDDADCAKFQHTSCHQDQNDKKKKCLCADYLPPSQSGCKKLQKGNGEPICPNSIHNTQHMYSTNIPASVQPEFRSYETRATFLRTVFLRPSAKG
jgi:hypothetical protein